ncbi:hypothetical protein [Pelagicoccus sp. SDUM812002]|uniref:hypothetical protein n=1 Tax=Pelagicoccus sp. SDUM812002 TaxID=3041266 RepID=UPI00280D2AEB|nr:hypothetical protein [Pelagicoccus sp. SDUM812002]MDQ8186957.1 hypothetical protein [Pelagicoccus sp. SDUM812002]
MPTSKTFVAFSILAYRRDSLWILGMRPSNYLEKVALYLNKRKAAIVISMGIATAFFLTGCGGNSQPRGIGPLANVVFSGSVDGWTGSLEDGIYWLENSAGDPNDIRYFYTSPTAGKNGERSAKVEVKTAEMNAEARAGLLYAYRESPRFYYLIVASNSGAVDIYQRDGNDFRLTQSNSISLKKDGTVQLEAIEKGRELTVIANGKKLATIENDNIGTGTLGIAAFGLGKFGFTNYEQSPDEAAQTANKETAKSPAQIKSPTSSSQKNLTMLDFKDPKNGMVQHRSPYPKGWRYDTNPNDQLVMTGPNGVQVYQTDSGRYVYSNDPSAIQSARMQGAQVAPPMALPDFLQQQYSPYMQQRGFRLTNSYPMPEIKSFWELLGASMPQGLSRKQFEVIGAEWENSNAQRAFTILVLSILQDQTYVTWNVNAGELYASNSEYETAKAAYVYGASNIEMNPDWQIAKNNELLAQIRANTQYWDARTKESQIQHISRMNAILARGEASSSIAKINSDILDISHAGYLKRSDMVSAGQAKSVNMIGEHSVISNPTTGELYKVDAGAQNYWVNADGKYFPTDNTLYDPRTDISISDQQWERFEVVE